MKKLILTPAFFLMLFLGISMLSATGLCKGNEGYYHDCDDDKYFKNMDKDYEAYYYYHGKYYPTRDDYYREYYQPKYNKNKYKEENYYKETTEYTQTIESRYKNKYGYENIKTTYSEKTKIESDYKIPSYVYLPRIYLDNNKNKDKKEEIIIKPIPWHYSLWKKYYGSN